jgi:hypothetical protein
LSESSRIVSRSQGRERLGEAVVGVGQIRVLLQRVAVLDGRRRVRALGEVRSTALEVLLRALLRRAAGDRQTGGQQRDDRQVPAAPPRRPVIACLRTQTGSPFSMSLEWRS